MSAWAIDERMEIEGRGALENKIWRSTSDECPGDRWDNGDL